jgi:hypothetical protein
MAAANKKKSCGDGGGEICFMRVKMVDFSTYCKNLSGK